MTDTNDSRIQDRGGFPGYWKIERTREETGAEVLEMFFEIESATGDSPPLNVHPEAEESYEVVTGTLEVNVEGDWRQVNAGETHRVPAGTPHTFRNLEPVEVINRHSPALEYERFFRRFHRLVTERGVTLPPKDFKSFVYMGMLFADHEREIVTVKPPQFVMRLLASLGGLLGHRLPEATPSPGA